MNLDIIKCGNCTTVEDFSKRIGEIVAELNRTKEAGCWVCNELVKNWVLLFPEKPDGLGLGASDRTDGLSGKKTRVVFVPVCPHHNLDDKKNLLKIRNKLNTLKMEMTN